MAAKEIGCILFAYLLGGICVGYYYTRWRTGKDIRNFGSGGVGARNVGRRLGKPGFVVTLLGDAAKGIVAVLLARHYGASETIIACVCFAVIVGHIWPVWLGFRGGRGIATAIGAYLAYDYHLALLLLAITLLLALFRRGVTLSGLAAFALLPLVVYALDQPGHTIATLTASSAIILYAHRERIRTVFQKALSEKEA